MSESIYGNINTDETWEMDNRDGEEINTDTKVDTKSHDVRTGTENQTPDHTGTETVTLTAFCASPFLFVIGSFANVFPLSLLADVFLL